jgi:protein-S-isoprenylcysteine O-methyltransferase Ste14
VAFTAAWALMFCFRVESLPAMLTAYDGAERFWVMATPAILATHAAAACIALSLVPRVEPLAALGAGAVYAAAVALWFWGRAQIGPLRRRRLPDEPPLRFRSDGAFALVRHPLYCAYVLAAGAPLIAVPRLWLLGSFAASVGAIAVRAIQEERRLRSQLGATYEAYCRRVKRLIPFVW